MRAQREHENNEREAVGAVQFNKRLKQKTLCLDLTVGSTNFN